MFSAARSISSYSPSPCSLYCSACRYMESNTLSLPDAFHAS